MTEELIQGKPRVACGAMRQRSASKIADLMARTKSGYGASRGITWPELICETLTGQPTESYMNAAMQRGTEKEPDARAAYELATDADVVTVGFVPHPGIAEAGCSPDGLVGEYGSSRSRRRTRQPTSRRFFRGAVADKYTSNKCSSRWPARDVYGAISFPSMIACQDRCGFSSSASSATTKLIAEIENEIAAFLMS